MGLLSPFTAVVFGLLSCAWFLTWLWGRQPRAIIVVGPQGSGKTTLGGELCTSLWAGPFEADSAQGTVSPEDKEKALQEVSDLVNSGILQQAQADELTKIITSESSDEESMLRSKILIRAILKEPYNGPEFNPKLVASAHNALRSLTVTLLLELNLDVILTGTMLGPRSWQQYLPMFEALDKHAKWKVLVLEMLPDNWKTKDQETQEFLRQRLMNYLDPKSDRKDIPFAKRLAYLVQGQQLYNHVNEFKNKCSFDIEIERYVPAIEVQQKKPDPREGLSASEVEAASKALPYLKDNEEFLATLRKVALVCGELLQRS